MPARERRQPVAERSLVWLAAAATTLVLLTGFFGLMVFSDVFHDYEHRRLRTVDKSLALSPQQFTDQLQSYFLSAGPALLQHPQLSYREKLHYREVKQLIRVGVAAFFWSAALAVGLFAWILVGTRRRGESRCRLVARVLRRTGLILLATIAASVLLSLNFDKSFVALHRLLFDGNNWLLPPTSLTIQMFPGQYFFDFLITYCALIAGSALLGLGGSAVCRRR